MFKILTQKEGSAVCLKPEGRLDTINSTKFLEEIQLYLEMEEFLIIDFSECNYLSSTGIRALLTTAKKLNTRGGGLLLANVTGEVFQVIEMTGLKNVFEIFGNIEEARKRISDKKGQVIIQKEFKIGSIKGIYKKTIDHKAQIIYWKNQGIAGYDELGISAGIGSPAESVDEKKEEVGFFVTIGNCSGFIPFNESISSDFRVLKNPSHGGIYLKWGLSFDTIPGDELQLVSEDKVNLNEFTKILASISESTKTDKIKGFVIADKNHDESSITVGFYIDSSMLGIQETEVEEDIKIRSVNIREDRFLIGARFILSSLDFSECDESFAGLISSSLNIENIEKVEKLSSHVSFSSPKVWLINSEKEIDAEEKRIKIEVIGDLPFESYKMFLARRLYSDSKRVVIKPLHGGFSAQTFQVESYDEDGRKLRPTVLKIANKDIIKREAERCSQYAMPYILNNSAIVLGTEFFGDMGSLRYNFVGIGGETTQLKWLTHYFNSMGSKELEPIFDKIFKQILKPWYGQPVRKTIYPFKDHDPTSTFFGNLCETAKEVLSISYEDKYLEIREIGEKIVNPYWYLNYEYERLRDWNIEYYTSICHGDLNMQNILLDQNMNVYLIDFSETRPRSIVSDFARLEAIFMCEHIGDLDEDDNKELIEFLVSFYGSAKLDDLPENRFRGILKQQMDKNIAMAMKMREYAIESSNGDTNVVPYYVALLEWILPIVCYFGAPITHKRVSMIISGIICSKLLKYFPE